MIYTSGAHQHTHTHRERERERDSIELKQSVGQRSTSAANNVNHSSPNSAIYKALKMRSRLVISINF